MLECSLRGDLYRQSKTYLGGLQLFYWIARFVVGLGLRIMYKIKITNLENVPKEKGVILCANHQFIIDPMLVGVAVKRRVSFMGKKELFDNKFYGLVLRGIDVFPVDRGATDLTAYRNAMKLLKGGKALGIFAQGKRSTEFDVRQGKVGAVFFAISAGVPIVPVGIKMKKNIFSTFELNFGEPIDYSEYKGMKLKSENLEEMTEDLMKKIDLCTKRCSVGGNHSS